MSKCLVLEEIHKRNYLKYEQKRNRVGQRLLLMYLVQFNHMGLLPWACTVHATACSWVCLVRAQVDSDWMLFLSLELPCLLIVSCDVWLQSLFMFRTYQHWAQTWLPSNAAYVESNGQELFPFHETMNSLRVWELQLEINMQQMRILSAFLGPRSQHSYLFSEGRQVTRMSRNSIWWPSALN